MRGGQAGQAEATKVAALVLEKKQQHHRYLIIIESVRALHF